MLGGVNVAYQVKWVEEHLGVTRKALRLFEDKGLMPKNIGGAYRGYSDEDIDRIWNIRLLQGIGYTLEEIGKMAESEEFDFEYSLDKKIAELEKKKEELEKHLGYAKTIKFTGRMPTRPSEMGNITFQEYYEQSLDNWNINEDTNLKEFQELGKMILNTPEEEITETEIGQLFGTLLKIKGMLENTDLIMLDKIIPIEISKRIKYGATDEEVQLLVKMMFDRVEVIPEFNGITKQQFVRLFSSNYVAGDVSKIRRKELGSEVCDFIADAIAVFGGYKKYDEIEG